MHGTCVFVNSRNKRAWNKWEDALAIQPISASKKPCVENLQYRIRLITKPLIGITAAFHCAVAEELLQAEHRTLAGNSDEDKYNCPMQVAGAESWPNKIMSDKVIPRITDNKTIQTTSTILTEAHWWT
eukprot:CAMPEP_0177615188 /NCGR_PEP_ID=MMETSP0419_2-20121207/23259_1 /TAXON_ID=582737 /ORGANISM="Tetraselmis sp., Strain GSL018" /LENGTH=127 /DNA_ID=CAMNT_0019112703 /DNA_START=117 /DNA_END=498 /DNA_ORIENTATION=-